jgi:UDP-glucose 4-epimerase
MKHVKFLVTGGAGFIGSNLVAELVRRGERVRVFDNFATGKMENIAEFVGDLELVEGDLRDLVAVREAVDSVSYILHQGALPSPQRSLEDPLSTYEVNTRGTLNLLIAAHDAGVRRVIYASSSSVYGDNPVLPPGMAGWALINYGYAASVEDALVRLQYDLYYIKHQSIWLDILILIRTVWSMLTLKGR